MTSETYNVEGNGGNVEKSATDDTQNSGSQQPMASGSCQERRLSGKLSCGWNNIQKAFASKTKKMFASRESIQCEHIPAKYCHVFRKKSRWEQIKLSGAVCGIEFCYAAETAFVTPILLSLGLSIKYVTIIWCLSPLVGLTLTPILGSMSDTCQSKFGRRRPFIVIYSIGILLGLILVPSGHHIGLALGDTGHEHSFVVKPTKTLSSIGSLLKTNRRTNLTSNYTAEQVFPVGYQQNFSNSLANSSGDLILFNQNISQTELKPWNQTNGELFPKPIEAHLQPWSIAFTVIGVVLLDFCADACQSPARTYLLDVSLPSDHTSGLSTFTIMAGLGGSLGYAMGAIDWDETFIGDILGGQIHAVFTINTIIFLVCLVISLTSFAEIPLFVLQDSTMHAEYQEKLHIKPKRKSVKELDNMNTKSNVYGSVNNKNDIDKTEKVLFNDLKMQIDNNDAQVQPVEINNKSTGNDLNENISDKNISNAETLQNAEVSVKVELSSSNEHPKLIDFLKSLIRMPNSLRILCFTNFLGWMACVCYSLYFTDFVGECVFGGDPQAAEDTPEYETFQDGVQFGCWGMALFCIACAIYSLFVEALVKKIGCKYVYIGGQMIYSISTLIMAITKHKVAVIILSPTAGVMYSTLLTIPYLIVADYHSKNQFSKKKKADGNNARGIGTDVAALASMMFLSQFILSVSMGNVAEAIGSSAVPLFTAALLSACGAVMATRVTYLNI